MTEDEKRSARYAAFMASPVWQQLRQQALQRAGFCCEFVDDDCDHDTFARCENRVELHVHHKTYARFAGQELLEDLQVLCPTHHGVVELLKLKCARCTDSVFDHASDALELWDYCRQQCDPQDWAEQLAAAKDEAPSECPYCDYVMSKDD